MSYILIFKQDGMAEYVVEPLTPNEVQYELRIRKAPPREHLKFVLAMEMQAGCSLVRQSVIAALDPSEEMKECHTIVSQLRRVLASTSMQNSNRGQIKSRTNAFLLRVERMGTRERWMSQVWSDLHSETIQIINTIRAKKVLENLEDFSLPNTSDTRPSPKVANGSKATNNTVRFPISQREIRGLQPTVK